MPPIQRRGERRRRRRRRAQLRRLVWSGGAPSLRHVQPQSSCDEPHTTGMFFFFKTNIFSNDPVVTRRPTALPWWFSANDASVAPRQRWGSLKSLSRDKVTRAPKGKRLRREKNTMLKRLDCKSLSYAKNIIQNIETNNSEQKKILIREKCVKSCKISMGEIERFFLFYSPWCVVSVCVSRV